MEVELHQQTKYERKLDQEGQYREARWYQISIDFECPTSLKHSVEICKMICGLITYELFYGTKVSENVFRAVCTILFLGCESSKYYCDHSKASSEFVRVTLRETIRFVTHMPLFPKDLPNKVDIKRSFSIQKNGLMAPMTFYKSKIRSGLLKHSDFFNHENFQAKKVEDFPRKKCKCNHVMDKLMKLGFPESAFNYSRTLQHLKMESQFSDVNSIEAKDSSEWTQSIQDSAGSSSKATIPVPAIMHRGESKTSVSRALAIFRK